MVNLNYITNEIATMQGILQVSLLVMDLMVEADWKYRF
jgi:hypothetical protein